MTDLESKAKHNGNLNGYHAGYAVGANVRAFCPTSCANPDMSSWQPIINEHGEPSVITKALFSAAITLGAWLAIASPANADPSVFGTLSCSCSDQVQPVPAPNGAGVAAPNPVDQGIESGLTEPRLHGHR